MTDAMHLMDSDEPAWRRRAEALLGIEPGTEDPDLATPIAKIRQQYEDGKLSPEREAEFVSLFGEHFLRPPGRSEAVAGTTYRPEVSGGHGGPDMSYAEDAHEEIPDEEFRTPGECARHGGWALLDGFGFCAVCRQQLEREAHEGESRL
jgi:hypothetical protein